MMMLRSRDWCALMLALAVFGWTRASSAGCGSDNDCKGERVCVDSACVEPPSRSCGTDSDCPGEEICELKRCALPLDEPAPEAPAPAAPVPVVTKPTYAPIYATPVTRSTETRGILGLIIAGPIVLGVSWLATIGVTAGLDADGDIIGMSAVPLVGPWIMMADDRTEDYTAALAVSGVLQAGGLTMFILGVAIRREVEVGGLGPVELEVTPLASPELAGVGVNGRF